MNTLYKVIKLMPPKIRVSILNQELRDVERRINYHNTWTHHFRKKAKEIRKMLDDETNGDEIID